MYLHIPGPGIIHQNGYGPDPVLHRSPGSIFHPDIRPGFIAGISRISGSGVNERREKNDEKKTRPETRQRAEC
jgi:hypothetical protein